MRPPLPLGASCLLVLVIYRIYVQLKELNRLEATSSALKKQAEGAVASYKSLSNEKDEMESTLKALRLKALSKLKEVAAETQPTGDSASEKDSEEASEKAVKAPTEDDSELQRLREQNEKLAAARTAAEKDVEVDPSCS